MIRIFLIPFIIALLFSNPLAAFILFTLAALTDWLDGFLARRLNQRSALGEFLDPLADKILVLSILVVLVEKGTVSFLPVVIILIRELAVMGLRIVAANKNISLPAEKLAKIKTVAQIIAVAGLILNLAWATPALWIATALSLVSGAKYLWILTK